MTLDFPLLSFFNISLYSDERVRTDEGGMLKDREQFAIAIAIRDVIGLCKCACNASFCIFVDDPVQLIL